MPFHKLINRAQHKGVLTMRGLASISEINRTATLNEYRKAVEEDNVTRAEKIRVANPDLDSDFNLIDQLQ